MGTISHARVIIVDEAIIAEKYRDIVERSTGTGGQSVVRHLIVILVHMDVS